MGRATPPKCRFCKVSEWNHVCYEERGHKPTVTPPKVALPSLAAERTAVERVFTELVTTVATERVTLRKATANNVTEENPALVLQAWRRKAAERQKRWRDKQRLVKQAQRA